MGRGSEEMKERGKRRRGKIRWGREREDTIGKEKGVATREKKK